MSYFFLFLTNLFTSLYTVYINVVKKETNLNIWAMLYYNNVTTMPALAVLAWYTGDIQKACGLCGGLMPLGARVFIVLGALY